MSYFCIVTLPGIPVREILAIRATCDRAAVACLNKLVVEWPGYETITLYDGERPVEIVANPAFGFSMVPLPSGPPDA